MNSVMSGWSWCWVALCMVVLVMANCVMPCEYGSIDPRHTMCAFTPRQCSGKTLIKSGGVSCQMKETILNSHNKLRQKVAMGQVRGQPPALNMRRMVWDEELATVAQRWADQCMPGHDRSRNVGRFTVGQNVAAAWTFERDLGDTPDFVTQVEAWFNEVTQYGFAKGSVDPFRFNKATGHYTQMAWAETHMVGCGYANYKDPSKGFTKIYVCNYGPGGNVIGGSMYNLGHPGQQYCVNDGLRPSTRYQGLCELKNVDYSSSCGGGDEGTYLQPPPAPPNPSDSNSLHHDPGHHDTRAPGHMMPPAPHQMPPSHHPEHPGHMMPPAPHQMPPSHHPEHPGHDQFHPGHGFSSEHSFQSEHEFSSEHGFPHEHGFTSDHGFQREHGFPPDNGFPSDHGFQQDHGFPSDHEFQSEHGDGHDIMRPAEFLMKGIQRPFMGLMKILNPWNILNRFAG